MRRRKCNWCIFRDGHREKIIKYSYQYSSNTEIAFTTRSGDYKYVEFPKESIEVCGAKDKYSIPKYYDNFSFYKYEEVYSDALRKFYMECRLCPDIDRIELIGVEYGDY